jgi:predicted unusual protein kinase regulating ubiquinone biosynthesis (AarF/ABC1/UbiB family)
MARVGARSGGIYLSTRARSVFADAGRREELNAEFQLRTAEEVALELGQMKGALMKLGQMASYLDQGLPEPVRGALADLQHEAPAMTPELAAGVVEAELGAPPGEMFAEWDPVPIAAASIGQVHRAITLDGLPVAVKVQYPGVDEAIAADLGNVKLLFGATGMAFPGLEPAALVTELSERLVEELDYEREAANQRLFTEHFRGHPFIHVPDVVSELSARRVLTSELAPGARFAEVEHWSQPERDLAAEAVFRFVFGSLYRLHAFNGDPHPGNYLFEPGGHVTFLDFGLVKRFVADEVATFHSMIDTMVLRPDASAFRGIVEDTGLLAAGQPFSDEEVEAYFGHFYEFVLEDRVTTIDAEYASETVRRMFDLGGEHAGLIRAANVPPSFVVIQRINLGLYAVLGQFNATANWRRIAEELWPFVNGAPSTPMGEAEAAWRAERSDHAP